MTSQPRKRTPRASSTFPTGFNKLFHYVVNTGTSVTINNLPRNERAEYTSTRARLNEYRRALHNEAMASGDSHRMAIAESFYAVTIREPEEINGQWQMVVELKEQAIGDAIEEILPQTESPHQPPVGTTPGERPREHPKQTLEGPPAINPNTVPESGAIAIEQLYRNLNTKEEG